MSFSFSFFFEEYRTWLRVKDRKGKTPRDFFIKSLNSHVVLTDLPNNFVSDVPTWGPQTPSYSKPTYVLKRKDCLRVHYDHQVPGVRLLVI